MSAATRPLPRPIEEETLVSSAHVHDLIRDKSDLERDLREARALNTNLMKQLNLAVAAGKVKDSFMVDGMLTVVLTTGRVQQLQTKCIATEHETSYRSIWVDLPAVPGTAARYEEAARTGDRFPGEMDVTDGTED
jgi:hypothetical protein